MTYSQLTIHQKINVKSHATKLVWIKAVMARVISGDPQRFGNPDRLPMKDNSRFDLGWNQSYH